MLHYHFSECTKILSYKIYASSVPAIVLETYYLMFPVEPCEPCPIYCSSPTKFSH